MDKSKLILGLVILLVLSILTQGFTSFSIGGSTAKAKEIAHEFIANTLMPGQEDGFEIKEVSVEEGLYKITVEVQGQEFQSYMTKNHSLFFTQGIEMNQEMAELAAQDSQEQEEIPQSDMPTVQLYLMSFCPFGNQAEELMKPVVEHLGDAVEVEPVYVLYDNFQGGGPEYCIDEESQYCSMHGASAARQDIRELCVYNNQPDKYWEFIVQVNQDCTAQNVDDCWQGSAQAVGVNTASVETCFNENKLAYAASQVELTTENQVSGSPAVLINGVNYVGERSSQGYKGAICGAFNQPPEACEQELDLPEGEAAGAAVDATCN